VVHDPGSDDVKKRVRGAVAELTAKFPMYPGRYKSKQTEANTAV